MVWWCGGVVVWWCGSVRRGGGGGGSGVGCAAGGGNSFHAATAGYNQSITRTLCSNTILQK